MLANFWHDVLYQPLLNVLFVLYDQTAGENLGLAVIELTLLMRFVLLPLSIISERKSTRLESLSRKVVELKQHFKNDPVKLREETRKLLRASKVSPWARMVVLGAQVLVLVLLYQVFLGGLSAAKLADLYDSVRQPDLVNTVFLGFNVAVRNVWWAIGVGVLLFVEIVVMQYGRRNALERRDVFYRYMFPIGATVILAQLPMVKCLFILTSMAFSTVLYGIRRGVGAVS